MSTINASSIPGTGKRLALVIGVNEAPRSYKPPLKYAAADAVAMAEALRQFGNFELLLPPLVGEKATSDSIKKSVLSLIRDRADEDMLLLYFSGHGVHITVEREDQPGVDQVYLVTNDFCEHEVEEDEDLHVSMRWLRDKLFIGTKAGRVLIILDCCYAGEVGRTGPDPHLKELLQQIAYYFDLPGAMRRTRPNGLRLALSAVGYNQLSEEKDGHGVMTGPLLQALHGSIDEVLEDEGQVSLQLLHRYLERVMPPEQKPSISGDSASRDCILARHPERALELHKRRSLHVTSDRPTNYLPFPRNPLFQPRPGEFELLDHLLFGPRTEQVPTCLGLVGVVGMGGVGKTQLAIELAYRCLDKHRFSAGVFWMTATGKNLFDWQRQFAELAVNTEYLPLGDDPANFENEARRARHFCRYLATHEDALLILDNVEDPHLVVTALPALAGSEVLSPILYTSRIKLVPHGVITHAVEELPEESALRLLLETTRPELLKEALTNSQEAEACAARAVCHGVGYLPLALVHLRGLLVRDKRLTLVRLAEVLTQRGVLELGKMQQGNIASLFATFWLSWEQVRGEGARRVLKLASIFPEAAPIPRWLLGLAADLGKGQDIFEPLGEACAQLRELSLMEELSGDQVRLHPLVRAFGHRLVAQDDNKGNALLEEAGERLINEFQDLNRIERRAQQEGYWGCLEQIRVARDYAELLLRGEVEQLSRIERWLSRESYLFSDGKWWPQLIPGLLYQQLHNRSLEEGHILERGKAPAQWLRQIGRVGAEDRSLLSIFLGHSRPLEDVAFSPDGSKIITASRDRTARLWETASGRELAILRGHLDEVVSVAFSPDGSKVLTRSWDRTARLWETASGRELAILRGHSGPVTSIAFSPDGSRVLTGSYGTARLWETASGRELAILQGHSNTKVSVAFSPDGSQVLTDSYDGTARLWETASGRELAILRGHLDEVVSVAFSPDGSKVLTRSDDGTARLWETASGRELAILGDHSSFVMSATFSPDGSKVLIGSYDGTARLWETASGREPAILGDHSGSVTSITFSPDGSRVLTGSYDGTARLWETASGRELITLRGHSNSVVSVAFSPDGSKALTGSWDRTARLWKTVNGRQRVTLRHSGSVTSIAFSPDGSRVLTGSYDGTARLWETASGRELAILRGHSGPVTSITFSPDGRIVVTCDEQGRAFFFHLLAMELGTPWGMYIATHKIGAVHWQHTTYVVLASMGSPRDRPHFYQLKLEGFG